MVVYTPLATMCNRLETASRFRTYHCHAASRSTGLKDTASFVARSTRLRVRSMLEGLERTPCSSFSVPWCRRYSSRIIKAANRKTYLEGFHTDFDVHE
jgi:hypothetical protein